MEAKKDEENKYFKIIKKLNKDTPIIVSLLLCLKANSFENEIFYLLAIFFRFIGLLIICGNYQNDENLTISYYFRTFLSYGLSEKLKITNLIYIIISIIIFVLLLIMIFFYTKIIIQIKNRDKSEIISIFKIQIILDHLCFLFFPYIIEFLSFIFYIQFIGDKYIIKKSLNSFKNIIISILNTISIIGFNIQSYFHILCFNNPLAQNNNKIKLNYGRNKIFIICTFQNIIMIESLSLYLKNNYFIIYKTTLNVLILILFIILYLYSHYSFNYNTKTNYLINILSIYCFYSILFDMLLYFLGYRFESHMIVFIYSFFKLIISLCFDYASNILYEKRMALVLKEELFKIYKDKNMYGSQNYYCLYYFNELYKKVREKNDENNLKKIVNIILLHQSNCNNIECKCKYIQIFPFGKKYINEYLNKFLERINFLIESIYVEFDYQKNYELTLLLAEHYYNFKNNPLLSYSMIQTIVYFYIKSLN